MNYIMMVIAVIAILFAGYFKAKYKFAWVKKDELTCDNCWNKEQCSFCGPLACKWESANLDTEGFEELPKQELDPIQECFFEIRNEFKASGYGNPSKMMVVALWNNEKGGVSFYGDVEDGDIFALILELGISKGYLFDKEKNDRLSRVFLREDSENADR